MRRFYSILALLCAGSVLGAFGCSEAPPINRVGVNVVDKSIFEGSWYMSRVVIDVDYEAAGLGTFPGDAAIDFAESALGAIPRIRWVIDQNFIYAYRDYEMIAGIDGAPRDPGDHLGQPVAAYAVESHFDIRRDYNPASGEETNVVVENDTDRRWYERQYMRVDWSKNVLPGYYGQVHNLYEVLGLYTREPVDLYVQQQSDFPDSWRPQYHFMNCRGAADTSAACDQNPGDRDWADDYPEGELYHFSLVNQEVLSPGEIADPINPGSLVNFCASVYSDAPACNSYAVYVRTSFLKVADDDCSDGACRQYEATNWNDSRFDRHGYFRVEQPTYDRSLAADDPAYFSTDFRNYSINRHNIWKQWRDDADAPIPYADREVRTIVWYSTPELPAHLVRPSIELVGAWNATLMSTIRGLRDRPDAVYPRVSCQTDNPDSYCYCTTDPDTGEVLAPDCPGQYNPFLEPSRAAAAGATAPYDCYVELPADAEPNMADDAVAGALTDASFNGWFDVRTVGTECATVLRINNCNRRDGGPDDGLLCQERGDMRYKFLSYVDQPGTRFLGIATLRGDPVSGQIMVGDANIGGPALDSYRTFALQQYDLLNGNLTEQELYTGEDVRSYLESLNQIDQPARPRTDFGVAIEGGYALPSALTGEVDRRMAAFMQRAERLQGPEGRANIFSDRMRDLAGTDIERRLMSNVETLVMAGFNSLPDGFGPDQIGDAILDQVSPFRVTANERMQQFMEIENKVSRANMLMPNEFVDDSVMNFVQRHRGWPRARLEYALNRSLYFETQLHELGHCFGLRHDFTGSADRHNYFDDYYAINARFPLPDPGTFDADGTPGLSATEQTTFEDAYRASRRSRELAGIDQWMNSSTMEYTANWYERTVSQTGRYDYAAIAFGYGDIVEAYDNSAGLATAAIDPTNTPRTNFRFYPGGEVCEVDADCSFSPTGTSRALLLQSNRDAGLTQRCVARAGGRGSLCSNFDDDIAELAAASPTPTWAPVIYEFCTDERAAGGGTAVGTLPLCNRFDEGDSYREIVTNVAEAYDRTYLWENFRRYKTSFNIGGYLFNRFIGRRIIILQNVYKSLLQQYVSDPTFRTDPGPFGFYDQFMATADTLNFYGRVLAQPDVGTYRWNDGWQRYERASSDPDRPGAQLRIPIGLGRYFNSIYQSGLTGITRVERIGTFYEKYFLMQLMTDRSAPGYNRDPSADFFVNFYDLFPLEMGQIFSGMIREESDAFSARLVCATGGTAANRTCTDPRLVYMDFYRGDCSAGSTTCRPDPVDVTYAGMPVLEGGSTFLLQYFAAVNGLTQFPTFFDTTFQNQLFVCVEGNGSCQRPSSSAVEGVDYARYTSDRYGRSFLAFQVEPSHTVANQTSIGFDMVSEADNTNFILRMLAKYNGEHRPVMQFRGTPFATSGFTGGEQIGIAIDGGPMTTITFTAAHQTAPQVAARIAAMLPTGTAAAVGGDRLHISCATAGGGSLDIQAVAGDVASVRAVGLTPGLRRWRALNPAFLTLGEERRIGRIPYTMPPDSATFGTEEDRLDRRLRSLESFFNQLIQLENEIGIGGYL